MDDLSSPSRWPWRKWILAGALSSAATTIVGPIAVGGCGGSSGGQTPDACAANNDACAAHLDACMAMQKDVGTDAPKHQKDASVDSGTPDAPGDGPAEASDGGAPAG
jgi:hypothetical protein